MLFNIGDAEMTVGELTLRGCYLGSNVSYNVKKMVENGYLAHERSVHDRRSIHVRLDREREQVAGLLDRDASASWRDAVASDAESPTIFRLTGVTLRRLERFWIRAADLVQRPAAAARPRARRRTSPCRTGDAFGSRVSSGR